MTAKQRTPEDVQAETAEIVCPEANASGTIPGQTETPSGGAKTAKRDVCPEPRTTELESGQTNNLEPDGPLGFVRPDLNPPRQQIRTNPWPDPITVAELGKPGEKTDYIVPGWVVPGHMSLLDSDPKVGKTFLLSYMLAGELAYKKTVYVTEESEALWCARCAKLDINGQVRFYIRPQCPTLSLWEQLIHKIAAWVKDHGTDLVVFDTFAKPQNRFSTQSSSVTAGT